MEPSRFVHHLVGASEIAEMLGVSRQRAHVLSQREGFPSPVARLAAGAIWERAAVEAWIDAVGRHLHHDDA